MAQLRRSLLLNILGEARKSATSKLARQTGVRCVCAGVILVGALLGLLILVGSLLALVDTSKLKALTDLGTDKYQGFQGGLYPEGKNDRPASHTAAGIALAKKVQPLDAEGKPNPDGKVALLAVGFSNTVQAFNGFMQVAKADKELNPKLVLVNGAVGGMSASMIQNPDDNGRGAKYWATVDERLKAAKVARTQIECPDELLDFPGQTRTGLEKLAQEALLVRLYDLGQISSSRAAEILHISRREFLDLLGRYGVSVFDERVDLEAEVRRGG
jgi:predicted HTH domain antitoxin